MASTAFQPHNLVQIVPRFTDVPSGVTDYAVRLAEGLRNRWGTHSVFLAGTPQDARNGVVTGWPTHAVASQSAHDLVRALDELRQTSPFDIIIVHVSGYGYARRGAPVWLESGLRRWLGRNRGVRVIGVFHELFARGKPWRSSFWYGPLQARVSRRLWQLAHAGLTTNTPYADQLLAWRPEARPFLTLMPVISTVGEPAALAPFRDRKPTAVVFGSPGLESRLYGAEVATLAQTVRRLGIGEIIDIGGRRQPPPAEIGGAFVRTLGKQPAAAISDEMSACRFGFLAYDLAHVGKSTVFAAYAAHGVIPVCFGPSVEIADGLSAGRHLLRPPIDISSETVLSAMQSELIAWYRHHDSSNLLEAIATLAGLADDRIATHDNGHAWSLHG
jgi:hypothetical protein